MIQIMYSQPQAGDDEDDRFDQDRAGTALVERVKPKLRKPRLYRVVMLNDDYTPMEFVVHVLEDFFSMNREMATRVMLTSAYRRQGGLWCLYPRYC
jgi:ATP-dependent Clp protease adapter protein ClpS